MEPRDLTNEITAELQSAQTAHATKHDHPNYWSSNATSLNTTATVSHLAFGTGHSIYQSTILPAILEAQSEVILVTCFWAKSPTLDDLNDALRQLSVKALRRGSTIKVRLHFSSSSLWQKLFHTQSLAGHVYPPSKWQSTLGLPRPGELRGLDLAIKSIFLLPFSVMHPKFIIVDRQTVFLPSANVSWESWFEGSMELQGPVVEQFVTFWQHFWASAEDREGSFTSGRAAVTAKLGLPPTPASHTLLASTVPRLKTIHCIFLPSPHHRNPQFMLPWQPCAAPPPTPLNISLLALFANAKQSIFVQTPNLTAPPVISALFAALSRGVDVKIVTSERLMVLEQLVTAGTTTKRCVQGLVRRHCALRTGRRGSAVDGSLEAGLMAGGGVGDLQVEFFRPRTGASNVQWEPVQSHLKLTVVDDRIAVHGSGNLDRASWYTSQELGVAFISAALVAGMKETLSTAMLGRTQVVYDSAGE